MFVKMNIALKWLFSADTQA